MAPSILIGSQLTKPSPEVSQSEDTSELPSEYYTNHARRTRRPRFNQQLQYCLKPEFCKWEIIFWDGKRQEYTIQNTFLPSQRLVVPPQAITALPH